MHNEAAALKSRHQLAAPKCTRLDSLIADAKALAVDVISQTGGHLQPISGEAVVGHYTGGKRRLFQQALDDIRQFGLQPEDARVRMFIKADKSHDDEVKAPRAIQYRSKRYALAWARYVHPMEQALYSFMDWTGTPICAKSRNMKERANDLVRKGEMFADPWYLCLDHSKFDAHVTKDLLKVESTFYQHLFAGRSRERVRHLMSMQFINSGCTRHGTVFKTPGTRMSGDQNTALGNTALNVLILGSWLKNIKHTLYVDGDDSVAIIEANDRANLPDLHITMNSMCMETKLEAETGDISQVEFCQTRPVLTQEGWRMVRNPHRVLSRAGWSCDWMAPSTISRWVRSVGLCELVMGRGVPILQTLGEKMVEAGCGKYILTDKHHQARVLQHSIERAQAIAITMETRLWFERAWGIDPATQIAIEATLNVEVIGRGTPEFEEFPYARVP